MKVIVDAQAYKKPKLVFGDDLPIQYLEQMEAVHHVAI